MRNVFDISSVLIICILCWLLLKGCDKQEQAESFNSALQDSLHKTRNDLGQEISTRLVIETTSKKQFLALKSKDSVIIALQDLVRKTKNVRSASILINQTSNTASGQTIVSGRDTVFLGDSILIYPEYHFARLNEWEDINITANKDSTSVKYKVFNQYEITQSLKKKGFFKDPETEITILNKNPYTETLDVRSYNIKNQSNKKKYILIGMLVGGGIAFFATH